MACKTESKNKNKHFRNIKFNGKIFSIYRKFDLKYKTWLINFLTGTDREGMSLIESTICTLLGFGPTRWCAGCGKTFDSGLPSLSSSRRFKQAALGFKFLSRTWRPKILPLDHNAHALSQERSTCFSNSVMTDTAWCKTPNFVWTLSELKCMAHIRPNSLNAPLMSRTRTLNVQ